MKKYIIVAALLIESMFNIYAQNQVIKYGSNIPTPGSYANCTGFILTNKFTYKATPGKPMSFKADPTVCKAEGQSVGASGDHNYIVAIQPLDATSVATFEGNNVTLDYGVRANISISYFDGLGRPDQTIQRGITPDKKDILLLQEYDVFGRESSTWLPVNSTDNSGNYRDIAAIKTRAKAVYGETRAFNEPVYEASPLNRVVEQYGPGDNWYSNKKRVQTEYLINKSTEAALTAILYKIGGTRNNPTISKSGNYANGELYVTKITDEDDNIAYEFKDKLGQVVLTRQMDGTTPLSTYYVYNDFGNLVYVLPPKANDVSNATLMNQFAYKYKYDNRNRCIEKKLPGAESIYYVYDKADRLIFSQDGEQRNKKVNGNSEWTFNKYDVFGRLIISGIYRTAYTHQAMQDTYSAMVFKESTGSGNYGYTWTTLSTIPEADVLLINYYDSYDIMLNTKDYYKKNLAYKPRAGYDTKYANAKGQLVGTRVKLMKPDGTSDNEIEGQIATAMYYDSKGRMIQSQSTNHLGGIDQEYIAYDFSGQPTQKLSIHNILVNGVSKQQQELYAYTYDHAGRLTKTAHSLNGAGAVLLAQNTYNEQGRLQTTMANNAANTKVSYDYNIRSWTKAITNNHFIENLEYTYSGNIDKQIWKQSNRTNQYIFAYDNLSRLKSATYTGTSGNYTTGYTYDWHGNILTLNRNGLLSDNKTYGSIDNMSFAYTGNQLKKITDSAPNLLSAGSTDFKNGANTEVEYTFNANGAMTQDLNKGIKSISYNSLNLPRQMVIENQQAKGTNLYTYATTGQKLRVIHQSADMRQLVPVSGTTLTKSTENRTTQKDYIGNKIYENGVLKQIQLGNGYIEGGKYYFYIKDHLGNNRIVANSSGGVEQSNEYYPFGGLIAEVSTNRDKQDFKYNGKEYDSMHGLNQYDYSARYYDPANIRFTTMDPMAEKYYSVSPYVYVANNPMKFIDPTGMKIVLGDMTDDEREDYDYTVQSYRESSSLFNALYKALDESEKTYTIGFGETSKDYEGNSNPGEFRKGENGGSIVYNNQKNLQNWSFGEEFFHAFQYDNNGMNGINVEFEAKIFNIAAKEQYIMGGEMEISGAESFVTKIKQGNFGSSTTPFVPSKVETPMFINEYIKASNAYANYNIKNNYGNFHYKQRSIGVPSNLIKLINLSNEK